ncbi:MAG TPA: SdiA-regulated domain-containing protein [Chitinophagaceae bacterium]|nr:SdiA-regulated domain-containing protein [Chitinophagaceae bacterium]
MINVNKNIRRRILSEQIPAWGLKVAAILILLSACKRKMIVLKSPPGYNFSAPQVTKLDMRLREISGIAWDKKRNLFLAEEDESGKLYVLDRDTKNIIPPTSVFGDKGDYEDIAVVDSIPYILRSDGTIFRINTDVSGGSSGTEVGKIQLPGTNDFESLYYDPDRKALIVICKNCATDEGRKISAFAFDLEAGAFVPKPVFQIDEVAIEKLSPRNSKKFEPSAAAINPVQKKLYILSAASRQLVITDLNGKVEGVYILVPAMFPQPEGICFRGKGNMYISNEGGSGKATLLEFDYKNSDIETKATQGIYYFSMPDDIMKLGKRINSPVSPVLHQN